MNAKNDQTVRRLTTLSTLTALALEVRLAELRKAAEETVRTRHALSALADGLVPSECDLSLVAVARTRALHERWVYKRRAELNLLLARQTAHWLEQRAHAATAFGRDDVLRHVRQDALAKAIKHFEKRV